MWPVACLAARMRLSLPCVASALLVLVGCSNPVEAPSGSRVEQTSPNEPSWACTATAPITLTPVAPNAQAVARASYSPAWRSLGVDVASLRLRTEAALTTKGRTYVVSRLADPYSVPAHAANGGRLTVFADDGRWSVDLFDVYSAALAEDADGTIALAIVGRTSESLRLLRIRGNEIEGDAPCVQAKPGTLAFGIGTDGRPVAWVKNGDVFRVVYDAAERKWTRDRGPFKTDAQGRGVIGPNDTVALAWSEDVGVFLDAKGVGWAALLEEGRSSFDKVRLGGPYDDYVATQMMRTSRGFTAAFCNTDSTGLFDDRSDTGERCYVWGATSKEWPENLSVGHEFAVVNDRVAAVEVSGSQVRYKADAATAPVLVADKTTVASAILATGTSREPVILVRAKDGITLEAIRERAPEELRVVLREPTL